MNKYKGFLKDDERFIRKRVSELGLNDNHLSPVLIEYTQRVKRDERNGKCQANLWLLDLTIEQALALNPVTS